MIVAEPLRKGEHCLLAGSELAHLVVVNAIHPPTALIQWKVAPPGGWTYELLDQVERELPGGWDAYDIYLNSNWIGSSEV